MKQEKMDIIEINSKIPLRTDNCKEIKGLTHCELNNSGVDVYKRQEQTNPDKENSKKDWKDTKIAEALYRL